MLAHEYRDTLLSGEGRTEEELRRALFTSEIGKVKREIKLRLINNADIRTLIDDQELSRVSRILRACSLIWPDRFRR